MLAGVVLAAGASSRMGQPKALLHIGRETFLSRILRSVRAVAGNRAIVTVARGDRNILGHIDLRYYRVLENARPPAAEQIGSIQTAIESVINLPVEAAIVWPVDHPVVTEGTVRNLAAAFLRSRRPVVMPVFRGHRGHPVVLSRVVFGELLSAPPAEGAKAVVRRDGARILEVEVEDPGVVEDIDCPADYARLLGRLGSDTAS